MQQRSYYLPKNEGNEIPHRWLFFDTETTSAPTGDGNDLLTLRLGYALLWVRGRPGHPEQTQWYTFTKPFHLCRLAAELAQTRTRLMLVAHNLQFDASVVGLLPTLTDLGWQVKHFISEPGRQVYNLRCEDRTILCVDSYNWFPFSVAELGARLDLPKLDMPDHDAPQDQWDAYCRRDVEIIYRATRAWTERVQTDNLGTFAVTLAGQAFNAFRHRFLSLPLLVDKDSGRTNLSRAAYYGGRCECFHLGKLPLDDYTMLDVNSLYPSVMRGNRYPLRPVDQGEGRIRWDGEQCWSFTQCVADVTVTTDEPLYPKRLRSHLAFPVGTFRTTLAGPELFLASERGHLAEIHRWVAYDTAPLFDAYVDHFYERRQECIAAGDEIGATINKLLLNTLYGKFGQRSPVWTAVDRDATRPFAAWEEYNVDAAEWRSYRTISGQVYAAGEPREAHLAIPSIAAFITSYARVYLLSLIEKAGWAHVYYCDTDSLLVDRHGCAALAGLLSDRDLGKLKVVWESRDVALYGLKSYRHDTEHKAAGLKKDSQLLPDGSFRTSDFWGLTHNWSAGVREGVIVHHYVKSLSRGYAKGTVAATGKVVPLVLSEG